MSKIFTSLTLLFPIILCGLSVHSQDTASLSASPQISTQYIDRVSAKAGSLEKELDKKSEQALARLQKQENKIRRKLAKLDTLAVAGVFANADEKYKELEQRLQGKLPSSYNSSLDTMLVSLKFLEGNNQLLLHAKEAKEKLKDALDRANGLNDQFSKAEEIKRFLKKRKEFLKSELSKFGFAKEFKKINKNLVYFSEQVSEYKEILRDSRKIERKAIELLSRTQGFKNFMRRNSMLATLFGAPGTDDLNSQASLAGLQSRSMVNGLIQQQIAAAGPGAQQIFSQNVAAAQAQLQQLKNKVAQFGGSSSDAEEREGLRINEQRKKKFWKKWEIDMNAQNNRANAVMPNSTTIGISAGFKPNNWLVAGLGIGGRIGWGKDIRHIEASYSGVSARSFTEIKLKGNLHAFGGLEMNYRPEIRSIEQLRDYSAWQKSLLVGISKVVSAKSKFFKKTKAQILWDAMSYQNTPRTQPLILRFGYNIK